MKKLHPLLSVLFLIYWGCEEEQSEEVTDTTPPTVSVSSHSSGQSVYEIVSIVVTTQDNDGISKVDFFIDDSLVSTDMESPYQYDWNTVLYQEDSEHIIKVVSYDRSDNSTESQPIMLIVKNNLGKPNPIEISSIIFENGGFTINWNQSTDNDFEYYQLEKSIDSLMNDYQIIHNTQSILDTFFTDSNVDPLTLQYYRVSIRDTLGLESKGSISVSSLDPVPIPVNVISVEYDFTEMKIEWNESTDGDFEYYRILHSETENGDKDSLSIITDITTTSYSLSQFNPTHQNWFWVEVIDTLGQVSIGDGLSNQIENPPSVSTIYPITYDEGFLIKWSKNNDNDFVKYKLYEGIWDHWYWGSVEESLIYETESVNDTTYFKTIQNYRYYRIVVEDIWNLQTTSEIVLGDYEIQLWGEVYSIQNTTNLNLSTQDLTGEIPSDIGHLVNLRRLYLSNCQLSGEIPPEIENLFQLNTLDLSLNQLSGHIPPEIGNLPYLRNLTLSVNQLSGQIPMEISNHSLLNKIFLQYNQLSGEIPYELFNSGELGYLNLSDNQFTGSIPSSIGNTYFNSISLSNNLLTGEIPDNICNLDNFDNFNISNNYLCPPYPSCVEDNIGIQDLSNCEGYVGLWGEYYSIENTTILNLYDNQLTGPIPSEIGNLTNLTYLNLGYNQLTGSIPPEIGNLTNLTYLDLYSNQLTGSIPSEIGNLTNLKYLDLKSNYQLTGSIPSEIGNLINLEFFSLLHNQLTGPIPPEIGNLTNLTYLRLSESQLTGEIPPEIGNLTNLETLILSNNQLTGSIPPEIGNLTNLTYLRLSQNQHTGSIPPEIGNLTNLTYFDLSDNQLTGEIPSEIGNLTNLTDLFLLNNELTGEIPETICDVIINMNPDYFRISNNQLCPPYPSCIEDYVGEQDTSDCD